MARLNTTVHVYDGADTIVYRPGDEVRPEHRAQITAPGVWVDEPGEDLQEDKPEGLSIPPKAGPGSGKKAWAAYAVDASAAQGMKIDIPGDATRDEIVAALTEAGIPTE